MLIIAPGQEAKYGYLFDFCNMKVYCVFSLESHFYDTDSPFILLLLLLLILLRATFFTLLSPLVSRPVTWRDFALLHRHGANCSITLFSYNVFDDNLIRYL